MDVHLFWADMVIAVTVGFAIGMVLAASMMEIQGHIEKEEEETK